MDFFGLGLGELVLIAIIALIFIGPKRLPSVIKQMVNGIQQFRQLSMNVKNELNKIYYDEIEPSVSDIKKQIKTQSENLLPDDAVQQFKSAKENIERMQKDFHSSKEEFKSSLEIKPDTDREEKSAKDNATSKTNNPVTPSSQTEPKETNKENI